MAELTQEQLAKLARLSHLKSLAQRTKTVTDNLQTQITGLGSAAIKTVKVNGTALTATENAVNLEFTVAKKTTANSGFAASYQVKANGVAVGDDIDIPKDWLLSGVSKGTVSAADKATDGKFEDDATFAEGDRYIDMAFNVKADGDGGTETTTHIYLNVQEFIDLYTAGNGLQESGGEFSIKLDSSLQNGLKVDSSGLGLGLAAGASTTYVAATGVFDDSVTYYSDANGTAADVSGKSNGDSVEGLYVAQVTPAKNGAMLGTDKAKLDGISSQANKVTVTTPGSGAIEIDGTSAAVVNIAADADVAQMLNEELPAPSSGSGD